MPLLRASCQSSQTLTEFYADLAERASGGLALSARRMLELVPLLEQTCAGISVWGVTSHEILHLHAEDDYASTALVFIEPRFLADTTAGRFVISYRAPLLAPQPDAPRYWRGLDRQGSATHCVSR